MQQEPLGFTPDRLTTFVTPFDSTRSGASRANFIRELGERLESVPAVRGVAATNVLPLTGQANLPTQPEGHPEQSIGGMEIRKVTPNYFEILGIPLRNGRSFTSDEVTASRPVAIVNETVAGNWWPAANAIGDRLTIGLVPRQTAHQRLASRGRRHCGRHEDRDAQSSAAADCFHTCEAGRGRHVVAPWIVKSDDSPGLAANLRAVIASVDRRQRVLQLRTMGAIVASTTATSRFNALLFAMFAGVAVILAAIGLYGVLSFLVAHRNHEIGIRMALGARRADVFGLFLRQGVTLTAVGLAVGLAPPG